MIRGLIMAVNATAARAATKKNSEGLSVGKRVVTLGKRSTCQKRAMPITVETMRSKSVNLSGLPTIALPRPFAPVAHSTTSASETEDASTAQEAPKRKTTPEG